MKDEELILKAVEYCNDIPARVKDFLSQDKEEPKPKFKAGDWVYWGGSSPTIGRIIRHCNEFADSWVLETANGKGKYDSCSENNLTHITPQEIESHLIKIAKEKFKKGSKISSVTSGNNFTFYNLEDIYYNINTDTLSNGGMHMYSKGKWAEIIPEKKKLPKTKEELIFLIQDAFIKQPSCIDLRLSEWINSFLKDYED